MILNILTSGDVCMRFAKTGSTTAPSATMYARQPAGTNAKCASGKSAEAEGWSAKISTKRILPSSRNASMMPTRPG